MPKLERKGMAELGVSPGPGLGPHAPVQWCGCSWAGVRLLVCPPPSRALHGAPVGQAWPAPSVPSPCLEEVKLHSVSYYSFIVIVWDGIPSPKG